MSQTSRLRPWEESNQASRPQTAAEADLSFLRALQQQPHNSPGAEGDPRRSSQTPHLRLNPPLLTEAQISSIEFVPPKRRRTDDHSQGIPVLHGGCCQASCTGPQCIRTREMLQNVKYEIATHERLVHGSSIDDKELPTNQNTNVPLAEAVREAANRLHHSNTELRKLLESNVTAKLLNQPGSSHSQPSIHDRRASVISNFQVEGSPASTQPLSSTFPTTSNNAMALQHPFSALSHTLPSILPPNPAPPSPVSIQTSIPQSQPTPFSLAPSVNSPQIGPSLSPASRAAAAHLQDIQHQLSVSQLAHKMLQNEHSTLVGRLERQRVRSAALERKFEVSDAEIVSLSNENERLEGAVKGLERQLAECVKARDDARKKTSEASSQYLKMIQLAGRLHGGLEETSWLEERDIMTKRIEELEAQVRKKGKRGLSGSPSHTKVEIDESVRPDARLRSLEEEVKLLKQRNNRLEGGIIAARQVAVTLAAQSQNVGSVLGRALEE